MGKCGCTNSGQSNCCGGCNSTPAMLVESVNHSEVINFNSGGSVYKSLTPFTVPACGQLGVITVEGRVFNPPPGSRVYISTNNTAAYLNVSNTVIYDPGTTAGCGCDKTVISANESYKYGNSPYTEITVVNACPDCNTTSPGTSLATGFTFLIDAPECLGGGLDSNVVLCDNFHVPAVGDTEVFSVSPDTAGFSIGQIITFADRTFTVVAVPTPTTLEVRNDGLGGSTPATVDGMDCSSIRIFIISQEDACGQETVDEVADAILVCDEGVAKKMKQDDDTFLVKRDGFIVPEKVIFDIPANSPTESCIVLNPLLDPQEYTLLVEDGSVFTEGQIVYFDCDDEARPFIIDNITGNTLTLTPGFSPIVAGAIANSCDNCSLVALPCCEQCNGNLETAGILFSGVRNLEGFPTQQFYGWNSYATAGAGQLPLSYTYTNNTYCPQTVFVEWASEIWGTLWVGSIDAEAVEPGIVRWVQAHDLTIQGTVGNVFAERSLIKNRRHFIADLKDSGDWAIKDGSASALEVGPSYGEEFGLPVTALPRNSSFLNVVVPLSRTEIVPVLPGETIVLRSRTQFVFGDTWTSLNWGTLASATLTSLAWLHESRMVLQIFNR